MYVYMYMFGLVHEVGVPEGPNHNRNPLSCVR